MAGYSPTPLQKKLGFKPGMRVLFRGAPDDYPEILGSFADAGRVTHSDQRDSYHVGSTERSPVVTAEPAQLVVAGSI